MPAAQGRHFAEPPRARRKPVHEGPWVRAIWEQIQREIDATDRQIDQLVYQLYALTDDEIHIVEDATR